MSLLRSMQNYLKDADDQSTACTGNTVCEPSDNDNSCKVVPYVSVALEIETRATADSQDTDFEINGKAYRRLCPEYYAWLRSRMVIAKKKLTPETFAALKARFMTVRDLALDLFGEDAIKHAVETFDGKSYVGLRSPAKGQSGETTDKTMPPPVYVENYEYPTGDHPELTFTQQVYRHALAEVDRIRDEAIAAGWSEARLYQNRGRYKLVGQDYGIVCFIEPGQRIGLVTQEKIEVICSGGHSLFFRWRNPYA